MSCRMALVTYTHPCYMASAKQDKLVVNPILNQLIYNLWNKDMRLL